MNEIVNMYGKIISTWQSDLHALPIGPPQIMVSLTQPHMVDAAALAEQQRQTGISVGERKKQREGKIAITEVKPAEVDVIERGETIVVEARVVKANKAGGERIAASTESASESKQS